LRMSSSLVLASAPVTAIPMLDATGVWEPWMRSNGSASWALMRGAQLRDLVDRPLVERDDARVRRLGLHVLDDGLAVAADEARAAVDLELRAVELVPARRSRPGAAPRPRPAAMPARQRGRAPGPPRSPHERRPRSSPRAARAVDRATASGSRRSRPPSPSGPPARARRAGRRAGYESRPPPRPSSASARASARRRPR